MSQKNNPSTELVRRSAGNLTHWTPMNELAEMRRQMDDLFSRAFGYTPLSRMIPGETQLSEPEVDIYETDDKVVAIAALPGYTLDQIEVEATGDTISIQGERRPFYENEKAVSHRQSWISGMTRFQAGYTLPSEIDPNKVKATFHNGVLQLEMPKTERARAKNVKVNVQAK